MLRVVRVATLDYMLSENIWFSYRKSSNKKSLDVPPEIHMESGKRGSILSEQNPQ